MSEHSEYECMMDWSQCPDYKCHYTNLIRYQCEKCQERYKMEEFTTKDSGQRETYSTGMVRDSASKTLRPDLIDQSMLIRWAELMGRGAIKYGERNWEKAATNQEYERFRASAFRHFIQWFNQTDTTEDHAAAIFFNVAGAEMVKGKLEKSLVV